MSQFRKVSSKNFAGAREDCTICMDKMGNREVKVKENDLMTVSFNEIEERYILALTFERDLVQ